MAESNGLWETTSFPGHFPCLVIGEIALGSAGHVIPKYPDFVHGYFKFTEIGCLVVIVLQSPYFSNKVTHFVHKRHTRSTQYLWLSIVFTFHYIFHTKVSLSAYVLALNQLCEILGSHIDALYVHNKAYKQDFLPRFWLVCLCFQPWQHPDPIPYWNSYYSLRTFWIN